MHDEEKRRAHENSAVTGVIELFAQPTAISPPEEASKAIVRYGLLHAYHARSALELLYYDASHSRSCITNITLLYTNPINTTVVISHAITDFETCCKLKPIHNGMISSYCIVGIPRNHRKLLTCYGIPTILGTVQ